MTGSRNHDVVKINTRKQRVGRRSHLRRIPFHFLRTCVRGKRQRSRFEDAKTCVLFVGYPRSGHTLIGAQMTAHRNMVISNELHSLKYLQLGYGRDQLLSMIVRKDRQFVGLGCLAKSYTCQIPNQWQGRHEKLLVIGDKKGAGSSQALLRNPELLKELRQRMQLRVRIIHVVRNPFDTITRIHVKSRKELHWAIDHFFRMCRGSSAVENANPDDVMTLRHEDYVANPQQMLANICRFVGVDTTQDYLDDCASLVYPSTRQARLEVDWSPTLVMQVNHYMKKIPVPCRQSIQ